MKLLLGLAAFAALAAPAALAQTVSPLTVMAGDPPKVTGTYPAQDQAVTPGVLVLKVTFDQKMLLSGFDFGAGPTGEALECVRTPRLLNDGKTFVLLCRTWPHKTYGVTFNASGQAGFANEGDVKATSATLSFTTTAVEPIRTVEAAVKAAGLTEIDGPVQETGNVAPPAVTAAAMAPTGHPSPSTKEPNLPRHGPARPVTRPAS